MGGHGITFPRKVPGREIPGQPDTFGDFFSSPKVYPFVIVLSCQEQVGEPVSSPFP